MAWKLEEKDMARRRSLTEGVEMGFAVAGDDEIPVAVRYSTAVVGTLYFLGRGYLFPANCGNHAHRQIGKLLILYFALVRGLNQYLERRLGIFIRHDNETNYIFLLAAKLIAYTILRYKKLKAEHVNKQAKQSVSKQSILLEAWKPVSIGYKRRWWECMALPDDVDPSDEGDFRMQIKNLAYTVQNLIERCLLLYMSQKDYNST